jgi:hypothetical protein
MFLGLNKPSRKELEDKCTRLTELAELHALEISNQDKRIKILTESVKNWSDKFNDKSVEQGPSAEASSNIQATSGADSETQSASDQASGRLTPEQEDERKRMQDLLMRSKVANSKLMQLLTKLQEDLTAQNVEMERLKQARQNQNVHSMEKDESAKDQETEGATAKESVGDSDAEPEFSLEMQQTLAKYAETL